MSTHTSEQNKALVENNGGDSNGKGYYAHVWKNVP